jgi:hypothetical protein
MKNHKYEKKKTLFMNARMKILTFQINARGEMFF